MAGFSGAIKLADMNDYLAPNQACIAPLLKPKKGAAAAAAAAAAAQDATPALKSNSGTRVRVEMELGGSDVGDLRFPGLAATGGAASTLSAFPAALPAGGHFDQIKTDPTKKTASVSLNDCLACSGCVTSAETVLITQQSTQEFLNVLEANALAAAAATATAASSSDAIVPPADSSSAAVSAPRVVVVSISPQSLTALAHDFGITPITCARKLNTFFTRRLTCHSFLDTSPALDVALIEAREEFVARYRHSQRTLGSGAAAVAARAAVAASAVAAKAASQTAGDDDEDDPNTVTPSFSSPLPVLTSECPGWTCYAEKTQGLEVLRHMSSVKSPQAILASWIKQYWASEHQVQPNSIYHVAIAPCYDKKLEGSRDDFFLEQFATRETDVVLTTGEVRELLRDRGVDLSASPSAGIDNSSGNSSAIEETPLDPTFWNVNADQTQLYRSVDTGGSGGYCENLFRYAALRLFNVRLDSDAALPYKAQRNADYRELVLEVGGQSVLSFALAYGFRNIQNLVRKMKMRKANAVAASADTSAAMTAAAATALEAAQSSDAIATPATLPSGTGGYHYVEVMACPSGCLNGGGQLRPPPPAGSDASVASVGSADIRLQKQLVADLDALFHAQRGPVCQPEDNPVVQRLYRDWLQGSKPYQGKARQLLHTQYHAVEKELANPLGIKW